jgi:hypothetical protein
MSDILRRKLPCRALHTSERFFHASVLANLQQIDAAPCVYTLPTLLRHTHAHATKIPHPLTHPGGVQPREIKGHNTSLSLLGVFILWFGWYGFNPGSALAILGSADVVGLAAVNSTLSAAAGTLSALALLMFLEFMDSGSVVYDLIGAGHGTRAGLVAITAACAVVEVPFHMPPCLLHSSDLCCCFAHASMAWSPNKSFILLTTLQRNVGYGNERIPISV